MKAFSILLYLLFCTTSLTAYVRPETVSESQWQELQPYLLPADHPAKKKLDHIFQAPGVLASADSLKKAKFSFKKGSHRDNLYVAKHSSLSKYILKLYVDEQSHIDEIPLLTKRIQGAYVIRDVIDRHHLQSFFKVPMKWLYPVPHTTGKRFILVVENMKLLNAAENSEAWKSAAVSKKILSHLRTILLEAGLYDSIYIDNIPFCRDGRIAFIDTEHFHWWPIHFNRLTPRLARASRTYWTSLWQ